MKFHTLCPLGLLFLLGVAACAARSQMFVNAAGRTTICQSSGYGIIGVAHSASIQERCENSMRSAGYVPIEEAGATGIITTEDLTVLKVQPASPADTAGVQPGWKLLSVNGQGVRTREEATALLFGPPGEAVTVEFLSGDGTRQTLQINRVPYPEVFGTQSK